MDRITPGAGARPSKLEVIAASGAARSACRAAVIAAMDGAPWKADEVGWRLGVCSDVAYSWRKPSDAGVLPETSKLWRMLTDPKVLGQGGHRTLVRETARAGGFEVVFPDGVGLDKDPAHVQVLDIAARLGALSAAIRAAGAKVDTAAERAAVAGPLDELIREALELKKSVEK